MKELGPLRAGAAAWLGAAGAFAVSGLFSSGSSLMTSLDSYAWMKFWYSLGASVGLGQHQVWAGTLPLPFIVVLPLFLLSGLCLLLGLLVQFWPRPPRP